MDSSIIAEMSDFHLMLSQTTKEVIYKTHQGSLLNLLARRLNIEFQKLSFKEISEIQLTFVILLEQIYLGSSIGFRL